MDKTAKRTLSITAIAVVFLAALLALHAIVAQSASPGVSYSLVTAEAKGVKYTPECLTECHLPLRITFDKAYAVDNAAKFTPKLERGIGDYQFDSLEFRRLVTVSEERTRWIADVQCSPWEETIFHEENQSETHIMHQNCTDNGYEERYTGEIDIWQPFTPEGFTFDADKEYLIDLVGKRKMRMGGSGSAVDAQFCFGERCTTEYAWWNSTGYAYRVNITNTTAYDLPFFVNGSGGWCGKHIVVNTKGDNKLAIYYNNCTDWKVIANDTEVWPSDDTSQEPTASSRLVYPLGMNYYPFDISGKYEDRGQWKANMTCTNCPTFNASGHIGGAYDFDGTNDQMAMVNKTDRTQHTMGGWFVAESYPSEGGTVLSAWPTGFAGYLRIAGAVPNTLWQGVVEGGQPLITYRKTVFSIWESHYMTWSESENGNLTAWFNGTWNASTAIYMGVSGEEKGWKIGGRWDNLSNTAWDGSADNVMFYNVELGTAEINALYRNQIGQNYLLGEVESAPSTSANESAGRTAIVSGISASTASSGTTYTGQQIYVYYLNGTQKLGTFDKVLSEGNQRWLFNYNTTGENYTGMESISPAIHVWENTSLTASQVTAQVSAFINATNT